VAKLAETAKHLAAAGITFRQIRLDEGDAIAAALPAALGGTMLFHAS
jgi:hypothetical protein